MPTRGPRPAKKSSFRPKIVELESRLNPVNAFALSGTNLLSFDTLSPAITQTTPITNVAAGEVIVGIDFRPQNGHLYALGVGTSSAAANTGTLYDISTRTGFATAVGPIGGVASTDGLPNPTAAGYAFDFNPAADAIRVIATDGDNFVISPNTGTTAANQTSVSGGRVYGGAGYTNNVPNTSASAPVTTEFAIDAATDTLYRIPTPGTPGAGDVAVGPLGVDFTAVNGFDVPAGVNATTSGQAVTSTATSGFAVLTVGGASRLYVVDMVTGASTLIGTVGSGAAVQGLAVQSDLGGYPAIGITGATLGTANLVRFNTSTPGTTSTPVAVNTPNETLVGVDYRPATGQLYGLGVNATTGNGTLYVINPQSGAVTVVGATGGIAFTTNGTTAVPLPDPATSEYGFDFNPTVDRIRVTTSTGLNFRLNPVNGAAVDGDNGGAAGSVTGTNPDGAINGSGVPGVSGAAYTSSFGTGGSPAAPAGVTTLYTLDPASDTLSIQNPANGGTQTATRFVVRINGATLDFTAVGGFDIPAGVRAAANNAAVPSGFGYATLTSGLTTNLYRIDLATGLATNLGTLPAGTSGLALGDTSGGVVIFQSTSLNATEGGPAVTVTLVRTPNFGGVIFPTGPQTVTVTVTGGTATSGADFAAGPYTVTFFDGATTASFTIPIVDDALLEGNETLVLTVTSVPGGAIGTLNTATLTIADNDPQPTAGVSAATATEGGTLAFTVTLSNPSTQAVTVRVATATGTAGAADFVPVAPFLDVVFAPGVTSQTVTVATLDDTLVEGTEAFTLNVVSVTNGSGTGAQGVGTILDNDVAPPPPPTPVRRFAVAQGPGGTGVVRVYDGATGQPLFALTPYPGFTGGVSVATGDLTGDGVPDVVTGAGAGGAPHVKAFDGVTGQEIRSFFAYDGAFRGGVSVAAGDVDGDGDADVVTGAGPGGGPHVKAFDGRSLAEVRSFFAYDAAMSKGVTVAAGDVTRDGADDIVTGTGPGGAPHVKAFDGRSLAEVRSFFAYDAGFAGGVNVAAGDLDADGTDDVITGAGAGGAPHVKAFDGGTGQEIRSVFAYDTAFRGGVRVGATDRNANGRADIVTGAGPGGGPHVKVFDGITLGELDSLFPFDAGFSGGVNVGGA